MSKLKKQRKRLNLRLREIAEKLNVSPQNVAQQEQRGISKISTAMQYATILNCNWTDLIDEPAPRAREL